MINFFNTKSFHLINPYFILGGFLMFALGVGIAHYLGYPLDWTAYILGQGCVTCLQLSLVMLTYYFGNFQSQQSFLLPAIITLTLAGILIAWIIKIGYGNPELIVILVFSFLLTFIYAVPPLRLINSGYGELILAVLMANIIPVLAFQLQAGIIHKLVAMATFPLTPLYLAMTIAVSLKDYQLDIKSTRITLLTSLGWERGMYYHNLLILIGYILIGLSITFGLPFRIAWVVLLSLPVGFYQVWQMSQIAQGAKPHWQLLSFTAMVTFGLTSYLLAFSFWIR